MTAIKVMHVVRSFSFEILFKDTQYIQALLQAETNRAPFVQ
jgi:hypothetical protein